MWSRLNKIRYLICFNGLVLVAIMAIVMIIGENQLILVPITIFTVWMLIWAKRKIDKHPELYRGA